MPLGYTFCVISALLANVDSWIHQMCMFDRNEGMGLSGQNGTRQCAHFHFKLLTKPRR